MLTPDQLAELERRARAATLGPWEYQTSNGWRRVGTTAANRGRMDGDIVANDAASPANMSYIAAASPVTVLALIARIAELEQERDHWKANHDNQVQRARILIERDDLPLERVKAYERYSALEQDAARYRWLTQDAYIGECFTERGTVLEICGTDREIPVYHERSTDRDEVDAAIDAAMMIQGCSSG
ncbi:hypothetical protein [Chromobacterium haemolyticum]|uniref:hypothetical protein n=1 Tax=Chromobacterium haemolyticum TaxID=394935 RepID=UPI00307F8248